MIANRPLRIAHRVSRIALALSLFLAGESFAQQAPATDSVVGVRTKQVRVSGGDVETRTAFSMYADGLQKEFSNLFGLADDDGSIPVEIIVSGSPKDFVTGRTAVIQPIVLAADGSFRLVLAVRLHTRYDQGEVRSELLSVLIYAAMLRPHLGRTDAIADGKALAVPSWLLRGIDELLRHRANGRPSDVFAGLVRSRRLMPVAEILAESGRALDPVTEDIFAASSAALISALLSQDGGQAGFRAFLGALPGAAGQDTMSLLRTHFPGLRGSADALEKWWSLEIAALGQLQAAEFLTPQQTEEALDGALAVQLEAETPKKPNGLGKLLPQGKPKEAFTGWVSDFERFEDREGARAALESSRMKLQALIVRGFPLYRDLLSRYDRAVTALVAGKERGVAAELKALETERAAIRLAMERVADYMNYYEATQAEGRSEAYDRYREIREKLERQGPPVRSDRITKYLDAVEREAAAPK